MDHEPQIAEIDVGFLRCDAIDLNQRRADSFLQMQHRVHRAIGRDLLLRQKQQPVERRLFARKADVLYSDAEKRNLFPQTFFRVAVIDAHRRVIDCLLDACHGAEGGKNRLGRRAERACH